MVMKKNQIMKNFGVINNQTSRTNVDIQNEQFDKCFTSLEDDLNHYFPLKTKSNGN